MKLDTSILIPTTHLPQIYPYFFVNPETQGIGGVVKRIVILLVDLDAIGLVFFGLDMHGKKKANNLQLKSVFIPTKKEALI